MQNPAHTIDLCERVLRRRFSRSLRSMREDFAGSALVARTFCQSGGRAIAVDHDADAFAACPRTEALTYLCSDVRAPSPYAVDVVVAENFSYGVFHTRAELLQYFDIAYRALLPDGAFILDIIGGAKFTAPHVSEHGDWSFEQLSFDPIQNRAKFVLHLSGEDAFRYDWRLWSIAELVDVLNDAGFDAEVWWRDGRGMYRPRKTASFADSYVAYAVGYKE